MTARVSSAGAIGRVLVGHASDSRSRTRRAIKLPPSVIASVVTFVVLLGAYLSTAAPDLTVWDASELATAAHTLGIPHPPGTPLWVLIGRVATLVFSSAGPARSVTLLSVWATAGAGALGAAMATRWIGARAAVAAAVGAGTMMSIWASATETEVYAVALLLSVAMLAAGERAGRQEIAADARVRWRALLAFLALLSVPLHLSALVALPAAVAFAWRGSRPRIGEVLTWMALGALALSAVAVLPLRAAQAPMLNSGRALSLGALFDVLTRAQYDVAGLWPRMAPLWIQLGNVFEWADWQVAFGLAPRPEPTWARTTLSVLWAWLALLGARALWRHDQRVGRAMVMLVGCATVGVALWLNLKAGPSYGAGVLPESALHEARERDYFFALGFWAWGMLAGAGMGAIAQRLARLLPAAVATAALALASVPLLANSTVMNRTREPVASITRGYARLLLDAVPMGGVLFTAGDNDSFPLWYLQQVEDLRTDVTVVTVPLLGARWYRQELASRTTLLDRTMTDPTVSLAAAMQQIVARANASRRVVRVSALLAAEQRRLLDPAVGWALEGLVYAPDSTLPPGGLGLDIPALNAARERVPPSLLRSLPAGSDAGARQLHALLRCTTITQPSDPLLVSACGGA